MNMADSRSSDEIRTKVLTENTAQGVHNHLTALKSNRARMITRWIWELLQNARDTSATFASIEQGQGEVIFRHDGTKFKMEEIAHLIYHGSTKVEDKGTIGRYGSGFLTTHLLSPIIDISGQLNEGQSFKFPLKREVGSVKELSASMEHAWNAFKDSLPEASPPDGFTTQFRYPGEDAARAAKDGLEDLKKCAPFVVVFNETFSCINIKSPDETVSFKVTHRAQLQGGLQEVTVAENENGNQKDRVFLLAAVRDAAVAVPLELIDNGDRALLAIDNTPRLFLGFPLIGTENFSFPGVINSFVFTPTEDRDGVYLWRNDDEANRKNQAVLEEACDLLINLLQFAASSGWYKTYSRANVPDICEQTWLDSDSLRRLLKEQLIERIRQTPTVLREHDAMIPKESILPFAEEEIGVEALWVLLDGLKEFRQQLPRQEDAVGWRNAIRSWATIRKCKATSFDEAFDGRRLASHIEKETTLENLQKLLREDICAVEWLNQLYQFLRENGLNEVIRTQSIILDQGGCLDELFNLHRDQGIAEELKDIAKLLEWNIRLELRDKRLTSLADEVGVGEWDSEYVARELVKKLQERTDEKPDDDFAKASRHLFKWIVKQEKWNLLHSFPVFAESSEPNGRIRLDLPHPEKEENRPLAPIGAWTEDLRQFSDLFPQSHILADAFFEAVPDPDAWRILDEKGFIRTDVIISKNVNFDKFFPDEPLPEGEHRTADSVTVTDITFLTGTINRVRGSRPLAQKFWRFLIEWVISHDSKGLEVEEAACECAEEQKHRYFQAKWLVPLVERKWVPLEGGRRDKATAQSLARLLRDSEWKPGSLNENPAAVKFLEAIGVTRFDLTREFVAGNPKTHEELDNAFTDILVATEEDISHLNHVRDFALDLANDEELPNVLAERRQNREIVQKNQRLGALVEKLVKENLENEGFSVTRTGVGSDYEIELLQEGQRWLVEVKSTQGQEVVRMTDTQARTAVKEEGRFLLCVVQVESGKTQPELDEVRDKMRFVKNIGSLVEPLCHDLDGFEELRDDITDGNPSGVQLEVESGTARIRVTKSVWDKGFHIEDLSKQLKEEAP